MNATFTFRAIYLRGADSCCRETIFNGGRFRCFTFLRPPLRKWVLRPNKDKRFWWIKKCLPSLYTTGLFLIFVSFPFFVHFFVTISFHQVNPIKYISLANTIGTLNSMICFHYLIATENNRHGLLTNEFKPRIVNSCNYTLRGSKIEISPVIIARK